MKLIILIFTLSLIISCDRGGDFSMKLEANGQGGEYLSDKEMQAQFTEQEKKKVGELCEILSKKEIELEKPLRFKITSRNCEDKEIKDEVLVKIEANGQHQYFNADKPFPFYQDQTNTQGVIKDLCQQQTGQKVVAMSNHGGTIRYWFDFNKSCSSGKYCLEAGTVVQDYKNKKMKLVRKELFHINKKGTIGQRELVYICKDGKTPFHYKAILQ